MRFQAVLWSASICRQCSACLASDKYKLEKYVLQFRQIHFTIWWNTFNNLGEELKLEMRFQAAFAGSGLLAWPQPPPKASGGGSRCSPTSERPMPTKPKSRTWTRSQFFFKKLRPIEPNANNRIFLRKMDISPALMATTSTHHKKGYIFWKKWRNLGGFKPFSVVQTQDQDLDQKPKKWTLFETCGEKWNTIPFKHSLTLSRGGGADLPPLSRICAYLHIRICLIHMAIPSVDLMYARHSVMARNWFSELSSDFSCILGKWQQTNSFHGENMKIKIFDKCVFRVTQIIIIVIVFPIASAA